MIMSIEQVEKLAIIALKRSYQVHQELGASGEELDQKNPFGETSLKMDIEAEKAVIDTFREEKVPLRIISEEHGTVDITKDPKYLAVLDGLDGSKEYKNNRGKGRYATMLGIFSNLNPRYDEYVFGGMMEHTTKRLFFVSKGKGSFVLSDGKKNPICCSNAKTLSKEKTRIYADVEFDKNRNITFIHDIFLSKLKGHKILHQCATAVHYADLVSGEADIILECTRKGNLEMAAAYGLVTEAGGVMVTIDGVSVAGKKYLEFGQNEYLPVISASTMELAKELINQVKN
ncbi:inositol monophosphatase family protein [Thermoproteota archaeon]